MYDKKWKIYMRRGHIRAHLVNLGTPFTPQKPYGYHKPLEGEKELLGKETGKDEDNNKATYPAFFGLEETRKKAKEAVTTAISALAGFDKEADPLRELAHYIYSRKK